MIFALLGALLNGILYLGGSSQRLEEVRSGVRENVVDSARRASADLALDDAEKVVVAARKEQALLQKDLERQLARPDVSPAELTATLDQLDKVEEAAFARLVTARRRLTLSVTPGEWRAIFPPPATGH